MTGLARARILTGTGTAVPAHTAPGLIMMCRLSRSRLGLQSSAKFSCFCAGIFFAKSFPYK
jgi:hypothetical protein